MAKGHSRYRQYVVETHMTLPLSLLLPPVDVAQEAGREEEVSYLKNRNTALCPRLSRHVSGQTCHVRESAAPGDIGQDDGGNFLHVSGHPEHCLDRCARLERNAGDDAACA